MHTEATDNLAEAVGKGQDLNKPANETHVKPIRAITVGKNRKQK